MLSWKLLSFNQLSTHQLYQLIKLRIDVFVVEQTCPYPELDDKDTLDGVYQLIGFMDDEIVACARLMAPGVSYDNVSIGRVATKLSCRGQGLGHKLVAEALSQCQGLWPDYSIDIGAQEHLSRFYAEYGFQPISDMYLEDDIPHIDMRLEK